jgi:outer membrane protein insertion porin family
MRPPCAETLHTGELQPEIIRRQTEEPCAMSEPTTERSHRDRPVRRLAWPAGFRRGVANRIVAFLLLPFLLVGGIPVSAQIDVDGKPIVAIEFKGLKSLSEETLRYYLGIEVGQALNEATLNQNIKELWDRSLIDDVQVEAVPATSSEVPAGVRLTITVQERPVLRSIDYQGTKRISKTDIQDKIVTQHIRVREGEPLSLGELQRLKALIEDLYREKGYRFAQARFAVEDIANNEKKVVFTVDEGDRVRIEDIAFEGNDVFPNYRLRLAMRKTKETGLISRFTKKDIYDPVKLQEDLDKVRDVYRGAGYKNVVIGDPKIEVRALHPKAAQVADQKRRMFITIPIEEGERWRFGQVTIEGNTVYKSEALLRTFANREGGWLRSKVIDDGIKKIQDYYHNSGYIYARVEPELVERGDKVADVTVHVVEGEQFKVGRIEFTGNDRTMDKVLRREVRLYEGGLVSIGAIKNSITKVNQLGYFKVNQEDPVELDYDNENKKVNLVFKGEEAERTELQFGGGWSELDGFFGQFAINTKNFLGRGEQVGLSFQSGRFRDYFDFSYFIPWFLDKPQTIGLRAFNQSYDYGFLANNQRNIRQSKGAIFSYGRNFGLFQSASLNFTRAKYDDEVQFRDETGTIVGSRSFIDSASIRPVYSYDSRDNPFEPTVGKKLTLSVEYAGGILRGDNYFVRPEVNFSIFKPVGSFPARQVMAANLEAGMIDPFGGRTISPLEYYYLGGENSVRGHRFRSIFPRDGKDALLVQPDGQIIGGDKFVQINLEYHVLVGGPFRALVFVDGGDVYAPGQSIDLSRLRLTTGLELRILVPVFGAPLRFIYSKNLTPLPQDRFESFQFSIGTSF